MVVILMIETQLLTVGCLQVLRKSQLLKKNLDFRQFELISLRLKIFQYVILFFAIILLRKLDK